MEVALAESFIGAAQPFVDGFGERRVVLDARGERLDVLRLNAALSGTPAFEASLRERAGRIAGFRHDAFARIRGIEIDRPNNTLLVISDHVRGARLATLLACAEKRSVPIDLPTATCIIRQLVMAAAAWRDQMPDAVHGAISPDRIMVTTEGRVMLVEQVLGSALEQLRYSRQRYWEELGVALPVTFNVAINARADVLQVGTVALALVLGRRLNADDRPDQIQPMALERLPLPVRRWLMKALQADPLGSFTSVTDARTALVDAFGEPSPIEQDALLLFMARCLALDVNTPLPSDDESRAANAAPAGVDDVPDVDLGTRIEALRAFLARRASRNDGASDRSSVAPPAEPTPTLPAAAEAPSTASATQTTSVTAAPPAPPQSSAPARQPMLRPAPTADATPRELPLQGSSPGVLTPAVPALAPAPDTDSPATRPHGFRSLLQTADGGNRRLWIGAAAALVLIVAALAIVGFSTWSRGPAAGTFSIETRPEGAGVIIDGQPRGVTPLSLDLSAGDHVVEVASATDRRRIPVTIKAGSQVSQFLEMSGQAPAAATAEASELRVRTEPIGAAVTVDGRYVGRSPVSVSDLAPGQHTVVMKHDAGTVTEQVLIEPGKAASLFVPLSVRPGGVGAAGWISVSGAEADVQLFENGRLLGSSRIDRIMLPVGRHELDIVNEPLGYQERRTIQVSAGQVTSINLKWPTGGLSINAVPWAQAFVDESPVGETPIANIQVPIGEHEITFRHPQFGERRATVTVVAGQTAKVGVEMRAKP
jgi:hypothetical protein